MQDNFDIFEYDSNTVQQKGLFDLHGIDSILLKERQKSCMICKL